MDTRILSLPADAPMATVIEAMTRERQSCVLALAPDGGLAGILTEQDVARRVVHRLGAEAPLAAAMSAPVEAVRADDYLYRAVARMRRHGFRHLPVIDSAARPVGVIDFHRIVAAVTGPLLAHVDRLAPDTDATALGGAKQAQAAFVAALLADGVAATEAIDIVNEINRDLHRRVLAAALEECGPPPAPFALLVMGSLGRGESLLAPDQDNGFLLADGPESHDAWFARLAGIFTAELDRIGFPLCKGDVMATNPQWRRPASAWRDAVLGWIDSRSGAAVLNADIFFDFAGLTGDPGAVAAIREPILNALARAPVFLAALAAETLRHPVGLDWLGRLRAGRDGRSDLKLHGLLPLVGAIRLYALAHRLAATGTRERIAALAERGVLAADEAAGLRLAFDALAGRILRQQVADRLAGRAAGSRVAVRALAVRDRAPLVEALRATALLATRARGDFTGRLI